MFFFFVSRTEIERALPFDNQTLSMIESKIFISCAKPLTAPRVEERDAKPAASSSVAESKIDIKYTA